MTVINTIEKYNSDTIRKYLTANGYTFLGEGMYQQAFKETDTGLCYKIGWESDGLSRYIKVAKDFESEYLAPVLESNEFVAFDGYSEEKWIQYRTELLTGKGRSGKTVSDFKKGVKIANYLRSEFMWGGGRSSKKKLIKFCVENFNALENSLLEIESFYDFVKAMIKRRGSNDLDVHNGNFMIRKDGNKKTLVMVDPYC